MTRDIHLQVTYRHPPARVWQALSDRRALSVWLMQTDFQPEVGSSFEFTTDPAPGFDGVVHGEVLKADPPRVLSYSWRGGGINTIVTYILEPTGDGTRLHFSQTGFEGLRGVAIGTILSRGWKSMSQTRLPSVLDQLAQRGPDALVTARRR